MNRITSRLGLTAIALVSGSALFAQSSTTGSVSGSVVGTNGRAVAGATVKLTSGQIFEQPSRMLREHFVSDF